MRVQDCWSERTKGAGMSRLDFAENSNATLGESFPVASGYSEILIQKQKWSLLWKVVKSCA